MNLYQNLNVVPPSAPPVIGSFYYTGCYVDAVNSTGSRSLSVEPVADFAHMTNEMCAAACVGFSYFGTEYGGECAFAIYPDLV